MHTARSANYYSTKTLSIGKQTPHISHVPILKQKHIQACTTKLPEYFFSTE